MLALSLALAVTSAVSPTRTIEITASRFRFDPNTIEVSQGERIALVLRSADGTHGFEVKGFGLKTKVPKGGQPVTLEFVASKSGRFDFACSEYCGSGHRGMRGTLLVKAGTP